MQRAVGRSLPFGSWIARPASSRHARTSSARRRFELNSAAVTPRCSRSLVALLGLHAVACATSRVYDGCHRPATSRPAISTAGPAGHSLGRCSSLSGDPGPTGRCAQPHRDADRARRPGRARGCGQPRPGARRRRRPRRPHARATRRPTRMPRRPSARAHRTTGRHSSATTSTGTTRTKRSDAASCPIHAPNAPGAPRGDMRGPSARRPATRVSLRFLWIRGDRRESSRIARR
jgi:hypothetical protein